MNEHEWEIIYSSSQTCLARMKVNNGYIYHNLTSNPKDIACSESMCFVPHSPCNPYQKSLDNIESFMATEILLREVKNESNS